MTVDFRSDTITRPSAAMMEAMLNADVGDDVFGEDPSVNELELYAAGLFGKEAALFCSSGTMTNQIAIKCHTNPAEEVICERQSHIYQYEGGGIAFNAGCQVKLIDGDRGRITAREIEQVINPDDVHKAKSSLVSLENTSNRGGGSCYRIEEVLKIKTLCTKLGIKFHLDGARLFNALVARNETTLEWGNLFDSISICLSKGLGAPVGSVLVGSKEYIQQARRFRKVLGGGMRQAGFLAAAGLYALKNNIPRLAEDHAHAQKIEAALQGKSFVSHIMPAETNIIIFEVRKPHTAKEIAALLEIKGIRTIAIASHQIRFVTHLDINPEMVDYTCSTLKSLD
ncbi:MAG: GntG family PLP-dependent aldolase [Agriterribacter sp.]